jgi:chromate transporter
MQTAGYVGLQARGLFGALASYVGFGLPAFVLMVLLSSLYAASRDLPWVSSLFHGLQVIVVAVVANATLTFGKAIKGILASFVGLLLFVTLKFAMAVPWDVIKGLIVAATFIALLRKIDILYIVPAGAALSLLLLR